ncbi:MAG: DUF167 domain-containing protein [Hydrogenothermaceae bacterium]|nr:DUF167 domain-containing protein [Hydrogenothermaceae bacterium]
MIVRVKVKPGASKDEVRKIEECLYEIRTTSLPEKGKANKRIIKLLAEFFGAPKSRISISRGESSRDKEVFINL